MTRAFIFPGQGSQAVGMGKELAAVFPAARQVFDEVDESLKQNLRRLMFEGPQEDLMLTENAQPAMMAASMAVMAVIKKEGGVEPRQICRFVAGHSLGEYTALTAAGALSLSDAAGLLKTRGRAMQDAVPVGEGAMAALIGLGLDEARAVALDAAQGDVCEVANDNTPGQVVLSGGRAAIERALEIASERGARRCVLLPVSAPFHCALMAPAAEAVAEALDGITISDPMVTLIANVTAGPVEDVAEIHRLLVEQVTAMVRWRESVLYMLDKGVDSLIEVGAGKVLTGLVRRINSDLTGIAVTAPDEIEAFLKTL
ncbi:MAG TPA: ACP S-malonyltransferase [Rhodospirillales bacterium]|nr:[acyl-carrier-protein] S-malonyltransferase [Rhodospirillaceae bacterium]HJN23119.1 ACP S-malonyltransferase [Rhodospirillales bacterium]